ncbi:hypothetical protein EDC01DRAFT_627403 [Geopyxis carbonaria]|nr:hypothetical protein EDC01DRAFT_627403 [Geopyxis carbonaria]
MNVCPPTPNATNENNRLPVSEAPYSFSMSEDVSSNGTTASPWDTSSLSVTPELPMTSSMEMPQQYGSPLQNNDWSRPRSDYTFGGVDSDEGNLGSSYGSSAGMLGSAAYPYTTRAQESDLSLNTNISRSLSETGSLSSAEPIASTTSTDMPYNYEEYNMAGHEYTHRNHQLSMSASTTPISPALSPRVGSLNGIRGSHHNRKSQSPLATSRVAPYNKADRRRPWSDSFYSPIVDPQLQAPSSIHSHHSSPTSSSTYHAPPLPPTYLQYGSGRLAPHFPGNEQMICIPSNGTHEPHHSHYAEFSEPPNLHSSLNEEHIPPPPEDMNPEDPNMIPHEQDLRFEGDLYTPRWVRGHGNKREGWCGICKPGRWLVLKNSAFWYDKSFTHGISAATGLPFHEPRKMRRMDGNPDVWEGLCHSCTDWVPLVSNKKKGTTWFRHAYKCHTHNKVKDAPKRRRESHGKAASAAAANARAKSEALKAQYSA